MPRIFHRVLSFEVEGQIYDNSTSAESIVNGYTWRLSKEPFNGKEVRLIGSHKDNRGRIVKCKKLPGMLKPAVPDTNYFLV
jgi:hypothetical protein